MKRDQIFPSKYLKASDLRGRDVTVEIESTEEVRLQGRPSVLIYFKGKEKALVLKPTIFDQIESVTGEYDTENWKGHEVTLYATTADYAGKSYDVIRVRDNKPARRTAAPPPDEPDDTDIPEDPDDEIPF